MLISWEKPKQKMSKEEWKSISADGAPDGVYTPNMSRKDMLKWKGNHIRGKDERVEIRKTAEYRGVRGNAYAQILLIVYPDGTIRMSANGTAYVEGDDLIMVIQEARDVFRGLMED